MKYRGENLHFRSNDSSFYRFHTPRTNGPTKPNLSFVDGGGCSTSIATPINGAQGQIELVEKMLNQITMHQSFNVVDNSGRLNSRNINTYGGKKNYIVYNSNYQNNVKNNKNNLKFAYSKANSSTSSPVATVNYCSQCEYVFTDGQLLPKFECMHKILPSPSAQTSSSNLVAELIPASSINDSSRIKPNFVSKSTTIPSTYVDLNKRQSIQVISNNLNSVKSTSGQCIIAKNKYENVIKFIEAQIIFDEDIIKVVPLQVKHNTTITSRRTSKSSTLESHYDSMSSKTCRMSRESSISSVSLQLHNYNKSSESHSLVVKSFNVDSGGSHMSSTALSQAVKKIRCLIANFITIQVEDDFSEDSNHFSNTNDDILQMIDKKKLGFLNFEGKNIDLYKNIGYINRNKTKFIRPTHQLLQL